MKQKYKWKSFNYGLCKEKRFKKIAWIPSHHLHWKFKLWAERCKGKTLLDVLNKLLNAKSLLTMPKNVLPLHLKQTFPLILWIFTEGEGDEIKSRPIPLLYCPKYVQFLHCVPKFTVNIYSVNMINQAYGLVRQRKRKEIPKKYPVYLSSATQPQVGGKICNGSLRDFRNSLFFKTATSGSPVF